MLHAFGVTCSYDEVLRFKKSAAATAVQEHSQSPITDASSGLVQIVANNFDADISSQNGKLSTHSLVILVTQPGSSNAADDISAFERIDKAQMSEPINYDVPMQQYNGAKSPEMPKNEAANTVPPLKFLAHEVILNRSSNRCNFEFVKDVIKTENFPEFNGYNSALCRSKDKLVHPKTRVSYLSLTRYHHIHPP